MKHDEYFQAALGLGKIHEMAESVAKLQRMAGIGEFQRLAAAVDMTKALGGSAALDLAKGLSFSDAAAKASDFGVSHAALGIGGSLAEALAHSPHLEGLGISAALRAGMMDPSLKNQLVAIQKATAANLLCGPGLKGISDRVAELGIASVSEHLKSIGSCGDEIKRLYGGSLSESLGALLASSALPSWFAFERDMHVSEGLLGIFDENGSGIAYWRQEEERATGPMHVAPWVTHIVEDRPANARRIVINVDVRCRRCKKSILITGKQSEVLSDERVNVGLEVFPFCQECALGWDGSAEFWLPEETPVAQRYELIDGAGEGDGKPAGKGILKLVKSDDPTEGE